MKAFCVIAVAMACVVGAFWGALAQDLPERYAKKLLPVGATAPAFELSGLEGKTVSLHEALEGRKAAIVFFWFQDCAICRNESREVQGIFADLKPHGLGVIAVNYHDGEATVLKHVTENRIDYPVAMNGEGEKDVVQKYGALAFPTTYLLDHEGKVVLRFIGFDDAQAKHLREKLAKMGVAAKPSK